MAITFPITFVSGSGDGVAVLIQDGVNADQIPNVNSVHIDQFDASGTWLVARVNFDKTAHWTYWVYPQNTIVIARNMARTEK